MPTPRVILLDAHAIEALDWPRIVAIRWDLFDSCIVLDVNIPIGEWENAPEQRAWIVFVGVVDVTCPLDAAAIPRGIHTDYPITSRQREDGLHEYSISALAGSFDASGNLKGDPRATVKIVAQHIRGAASFDALYFGDNPTYQQRQSLASDEELLQAFGNIW